IGFESRFPDFDSIADSRQAPVFDHVVQKRDIDRIAQSARQDETIRIQYVGDVNEPLRYMLEPSLDDSLRQEISSFCCCENCVSRKGSRAFRQRRLVFSNSID